MNMQDEWLMSLRSWAAGNDCVRELWLFGSRVSDRSTPDGGIDLAIVLTLIEGKHDWAAEKFHELYDQWTRQLEYIVDRHVSLQAIEPGSPEDKLVRSSGELLWARI